MGNANTCISENEFIIKTTKSKKHCAKAQTHSVQLLSSGIFHYCLAPGTCYATHAFYIAPRSIAYFHDVLCHHAKRD